MPFTNEEWNQVFEAVKSIDEYKYKMLDFVPDVVYDIGADGGSTAVFAHEVFPSAKIVAIEPNRDNYNELVRRTEGIAEIIPVNAAVGHGVMYCPDIDAPLNFAVLCEDAPSLPDGWNKATVDVVSLDELYSAYGGSKYIVKMDCEGAEYNIIMHDESRKVILGSEYFSAEFHLWGRGTGKERMVVDELMWFLHELRQTHTEYTYSYGAALHAWAKKRFPNESVIDWLRII